MEVRAGYKQTDVGVIPEEWDCVPARQIGRFRGGSGFPVRYQGSVEGDYPFFKVSDMNNDGNETFMVNANNWISEQTRKRLGAVAFPANSIVFAKVGAAVFLERKRVLNRPSCIDNNMAAYALDARCADFRFVHAQLLEKKLGALVAATALPALNTQQLGDMSLALPKLPEQRVIATALNDMDALLDGLDRLIAKKRDLKQAAMQELLTGRRRLHGFQGQWQTRTFDQLFQFLSTGNNPRAELTPDGDIGYIHYGDIHTSTESFLDCSAATLPQIKRQMVGNLPFVQDGDLVMVDASEDYAGLGKSIEVRNVGGWQIVGGLHTFLLRGNRELLADGFKGYLQYMPEVRNGLVRLATGISVYGVSKGNVKSIEVTLPDVPEQTAIADVLSDMDAEIGALEQRLAKTRALKQGMMQELLTGKTRLV